MSANGRLVYCDRNPVRHNPYFYCKTRKFGPRFALIRHCFDEFRFSSVAVTEKSAEMSIW